MVVVDLEAVSTRDGDEALLFDLQVQPKYSQIPDCQKKTFQNTKKAQSKFTRFYQFFRTTVPNAPHLMVFLFFSP